MAEDVNITPRVEKAEFPARITGSMQDLAVEIKKVPFYSVSVSGDALFAVMVESRNIKKRPYLFHILNFSENKLTLIYSIVQDSSEDMRRATVLRYASSLLSMVSDRCQVDQGSFYQYIDSVLGNILTGISQPFSALFNKYGSLVSEYREVKRINLELSASNRNLTLQSSKLDEENKKLKAQLEKLETYSDESLMAMVQDWLEVHNSTIEVNDFAKNHGISAPRVEQILDKMVSKGYLELKS